MTSVDIKYQSITSQALTALSA